MMTPREAALCTGEITKKWTGYREIHIKSKQNPCVIPKISVPLPTYSISPEQL